VAQKERLVFGKITVFRFLFYTDSSPSDFGLQIYGFVLVAQTTNENFNLKKKRENNA
jgi:hypothetical protein